LNWSKTKETFFSGLTNLSHCHKVLYRQNVIKLNNSQLNNDFKFSFKRRKNQLILILKFQKAMICSKPNA
jgi:hypothetical protein